MLEIKELVFSRHFLLLLFFTTERRDRNKIITKQTNKQKNKKREKKKEKKKIMFENSPSITCSDFSRATISGTSCMHQRQVS